MRAMVFEGLGHPLRLAEISKPTPGAHEALIKISACGVCRTDLHILDGELATPKLPLILGHEIVGRIVELGAGVTGLQPGQRVGVPWLGRTCGSCPYCLANHENLCDHAKFTGYTLDGGYAEYCVAQASYIFPLPDGPSDAALAPLLCAGLIGHRSLKMAGAAERLGIYGFGAAAHIVAQIAKWQGRQIFAFTRPGDHVAQKFALRLGSTWAGGSDELPPGPLDAAIIFASVGALVPQALRAIRKGGTVVCGGIHMSDIPGFPYSDLWGERIIRSVANLTRADGDEFFSLIIPAQVATEIEQFPLVEANLALDRLRRGDISGAAVLRMT
jgi:propanol-preferring alcohol dehydrogenase